MFGDYRVTTTDCKQDCIACHAILGEILGELEIRSRGKDLIKQHCSSLINPLPNIRFVSD